VSLSVLWNTGVARGSCALRCSESLVILCFEKRYPKQNTVTTQKSKILTPKLLGWLHHWCEELIRIWKKWKFCKKMYQRERLCIKCECCIDKHGLQWNKDQSEILGSLCFTVGWFYNKFLRLPLLAHACAAVI